MNTPEVPKVPKGAKTTYGTPGAKRATPIGGVAPTFGPHTALKSFGPRFTLTLRPVPGNWQTPPEQRLRAALKRLLRNYGLRCIHCQPASAPAAALDEAEPDRRQGVLGVAFPPIHSPYPFPLPTCNYCTHVALRCANIARTLIDDHTVKESTVHK